jgi:hypothetical protein
MSWWAVGGVVVLKQQIGWCEVVVALLNLHLGEVAGARLRQQRRAKTCLT